MPEHTHANTRSNESRDKMDRHAIYSQFDNFDAIQKDGQDLQLASRKRVAFE